MSESSSSVTLKALPLETVEHIVFYLPKNSLLQLRLVSRRLASIATPGAFRTFNLKVHPKSGEGFINIAKSDKLRSFLREFTCDTWQETFAIRDFEHVFVDYSVYQAPRGFMEALSFLRYFQHLESLHIQFTKDLNWCDDGELELRKKVILTVFEGLAGTGSPDQTSHSSEHDGEQDPSQHASPVFPTALTIENLGSPDDKKLIALPAFQAIFASGRVRNLKIHLAGEVITDDEGTDHCDSNDRHDFYERIPTIWLTPQVIENLRELSLTAMEWWGWSPHKDLCDIGGHNGLPNLKVLTLGKYVFGFQRQVDWLASLSLEEIHFDQCSVLYRTFNAVDGSDPTPEWWTAPRPPDTTITLLSLRWHLMLNQWSKSMKTLRGFYMQSAGTTDFRYVDNVGDSFCYEQDDDDVGSWNRHFVLEPGTREKDRLALDHFLSVIESRSKQEEQRSRVRSDWG
ncbi:hypothetical protein B0T10DRAFT_487865 [Thelonectria olida]|uniref:F-box domain-containing protein n=1 Tax=Thelonectria olida TaxID=1576542 RepID=A0A9P8W4W7_9HYPO|nr:hypothetical protein B0T10DRAFT_487865 [Thelonectria olida]